jgi:hypothetical protein
MFDYVVGLIEEIRTEFVVIRGDFVDGMIEYEVFEEPLIVEEVHRIVGVVSDTGKEEVVVIDKVGMRSEGLLGVEDMTILSVFVGMFVDGHVAILEGIVEVVIIAVDVVGSRMVGSHGEGDVMISCGRDSISLSVGDAWGYKGVHWKY